jgi:hypothetical protein
MVSSFEQLVKTDRRKQWKGLKEKYKEAIKKSKVDFDQKLGPGLDKYQAQVEKVTSLAGKGRLNTVQVQPVYLAAVALKPIASSYVSLVGKLEEPAKKDMGALLAAIQADILSWEELAKKTAEQPASGGATEAEKKAVGATMEALQNTRNKCLGLVTRGPGAVAFYAGAKRAKAGAMASAIVESARSAGSAAHELVNAAEVVRNKGTNYDLFKTRAKAASVLIQKVITAVDAFHAKWENDVEDTTMASENVGAASLNAAKAQMDVDFVKAVAAIGKLP